jgi:hypothetical protein
MQGIPSTWGQKHIHTSMIGWTFLVRKWLIQWLQSISCQLLMWERPIALILLSPTMVQRSLTVFVGTTFGKLNVVNQVLINVAKIY